MRTNNLSYSKIIFHCDCCLCTAVKSVLSETLLTAKYIFINIFLEFIFTPSPSWTPFPAWIYPFKPKYCLTKCGYALQIALFIFYKMM